MDQNEPGSKKPTQRPYLWVDIALFALAITSLIALFLPVCEVSKWVYSEGAEPQYIVYWDDPFSLNIWLEALWADILPIIVFPFSVGLSILNIAWPSNPKPKPYRILSYVAFGIFIVLALACAINAQCGMNSLAY